MIAVADHLDAIADRPFDFRWRGLDRGETTDERGRLRAVAAGDVEGCLQAAELMQAGEVGSRESSS